MLDKADWVIATDFFKGFTEVRCLSIYASFRKQVQATWDFIASILPHMRVLQHLTLESRGCGNVFPHVWRCVDVPSLQVLSDDGASHRKQGWKPIPRSGIRKASFTTLYVSTYHDAAAISDLIQWPGKLQHFHFEHFRVSTHYLDLRMLGVWLSSHKDSLQTIDIGFLSRAGRGPLLDVSGFPSLTSLKLSRHSFSDRLESLPESDPQQLLAPNLETFTWDFDSDDGDPVPWNGFGELEERWLEGFVKTAGSKSPLLKTIRIIFRPDEEDSKASDGYPWDRLDRVRERCRPLGIRLEYDEPPLSKEAWLECLEEEDEERGRGSVEDVGNAPR